MNFTLEGKITQQSPGKLTVNTGENIVFHVRYDEKTKITHEDGGEASAKDLQVGKRIRVEGNLTENGEVKAQKIVVLKESSKERRAYSAAVLVPQI